MKEVNLLPSEYRSKPITLKSIILLLLLALLLGIIVKYAYIDLIQKDRDGQQGFSLGMDGSSNPKVAFSPGLVYDGTQ